MTELFYESASICGIMTLALYRFTSEVSDKLFHLPSLGVKHFPFNVGLFSE